MDVIYVGQEIDINWSIRRNASEVLEDFSKADLKVFLTGNDFDGNYDGKYYFANIIDDQGRVRLVIEAGSLTPGTYCIEGIWIKNSHELLNSGWTRSISRARKDRIFKISDVEEECTDYDKSEGHVVEVSHEINIATGTTSYGYDGMSAYETAVFNGSTAKTEKEWIDTYEKAEDRVNYEMDETHDGSVPGEPQSWANAELKRKQSEGQLGDSDPYYATSRIKKENDRQTAESNRATAENNRETAETQRKKNEGQLGSSDPDYDTSRIKMEADRQTAESNRVTAENNRATAENTRVQNEGSGGPSSAGYSTSRIKNELDRQAAEGSVTIPAGEGHPMPSAGSGRLYNEAVRQHNEDEREAAEAVRQATFTENEGTKQGSKAGDGSRWGEYKEAEATRNNSYVTVEGSRNTSYSGAERSRDESYVSAESERNIRYGTAEGTLADSKVGDGSRSGAYKTAEAARQSNYEANEGTSESSGDDSRWDAYKEAEAQRQSDFETAETARNAGMAPLVGIFGCSTASGTATKEVTISNYVLTNGGAFKVKFENANTASSPVLQINTETAKAIIFNGAAASADNTWGAGEVVEFYYDPTYNSNAGGFIGRSTVVRVSQNIETTLNNAASIKIGDNICNIQDKFELPKTEKSCALLNEDIEFKSGLFINPSGQIEAASGYKTTEYIKVKEGEVYLYSGTFSGVTYYYVWGYTDLNGGGAIGLLQCGTDYSVNPAEFTIPTGVKYIRAWGPSWKATLKLKNNLVDKISQATSNIAGLGARMSSVENIIPEIIDLLPQKEVVGLETFEEHLAALSESTTFNGFATRYSLNGAIKRIVTNEVFWSPNTCAFTCEIVSGDFSQVLGVASVSLPSSNKTRKVTFNFTEPIEVNGDFYIRLTSTDGYIPNTANAKSDECTATTEYQNKYKLSSSESWSNSGVGVDGYCIDATFYILESTAVVQNPNIIHIGDFYGADYSEIQPAINAITDTEQPYILVVHPKVGKYAPFSMIRESFDTSYPWNNSTPKNISIIGIDKEHCIIEAKGGDYYHPAAELLTNGIIKNLTFILSNSEHIAESTQGGYAAHIDSRTIDDVGYKMIIENCKFESETGPAVGVGTHQNANLSFKGCEFINFADPSYSPISGYSNIANWGAVFTHTSTITGATNQKISFEDCVGYSVLGNQSLRMSVYSTNCTMKLIRNVFWSYAVNSPAYSLGAGIVYDAMNYGNNIPS